MTAVTDRAGARPTWGQLRINPEHPAIAVNSSTGCWEWISAKSYGTVRVDGKTAQAHRLSWTQQNGPIPTGMFVCHKCDNPPCCNPAHLFLGSHRDNMLDMGRKGRGRNASESVTHCPQGHAYEEQNVRFAVSTDGRRRRNCKTCDRARCRRRRAANSTPRIYTRKTHCPQGHPYDEANTYTCPQGKRACRACHSAAARRHAMRKADAK